MNEDVVDHIAELAYLTVDDDRFILNLQENGDFVRIEISPAQLKGIVLEGVEILLKERVK